MMQNIYKGKRVLVTGHTGFKGSWLSIWLSELGAQVIGYSLEPPSEPSNFEACGLLQKIIHIHGDIRNSDELTCVFKDHRPEIVFHLAAQPLVRLSYEQPRLTYETNVMGTLNVLEAIRAVDSVRVMINVTSDKCYENREWIWGYRENDPMGGHDPYSSSKGCVELLNLAYLRSYFPAEKYGKTHQLAMASVRAGNVIGGGDWGTDRLIPDCVRCLSREEEIVIRYPKAIRPWQHVLESLNGYLLLGGKLWTDGTQYNGAWNFGPIGSEVWSVEKLVQEVIRLWGKGSYRVESEDYLHEASWLKLDCSKALINLGWIPRHNLKRALDLTVKWYQKYYEGAPQDKMREACIKQIEEYGT